MMVLLSQSSADGDVIGIYLLDITDFAVTSNRSKYQHPRATKKHERNLKRKQKKLEPKTDETTNNRLQAKLAVAKVHSKIKRVREDFLHKLSRKIVDENFRHSSGKSGSKKHGEKPLPSQSNI